MNYGVHNYLGNKIQTNIKISLHLFCCITINCALFIINRKSSTNTMKKISRKKAISKEKLVSESENDSEYAYDNNLGITAEVEVYTNANDLSYEDKNYVMQKFLGNESSHGKPSDSTIKTLNLNDSIAKQSIEEDKDDDVESNLSQISNATYKVSIPEGNPKKKIVTKKEEEENLSGQKNNMYKDVETKETIQYVDEIKKLKRDKSKIKNDLQEVEEIKTKNNNKLKKSKSKTRDESSSRKKTDIDNDNEKDIDEADNDNETDDDNKITKSVVSTEENNNEILTITISKTDRLLLNSYVFCAAINIYFIDTETGDFVKKSNPQRSVNIKNIESESFVDFIGPLSSKQYNLINNRELIPNWNETIIINENFTYLQTYNSLIIFFEIIESSNVEVTKDSDRIIAWAFLKPKHNYNENLRLQLFHPQTTRSIKQLNTCKAYNWWKKKKMTKYPSTLYVTLANTQLPNKILKLWMNKSKPSSAKEETETSQNNEIKDDITSTILQKEPISLKLTKKMFKIPAEKLYQIETSINGCYIHKFSDNGNYLALAISEDNIFKIFIYDLSNQEKICELKSHQNIIYDIVWTNNNKQMLSASADCTVILWDLTLQKIEYCFPHPSFVYCCTSSNLSTDNYFATGCFDKTIRLWSFTSYQLLEELKGHQGYVTSICFNKENYFMYSADSIGVIFMWHKDKEQEKWSIKKHIVVLDLSNVVINQIILHRRERRLLVNSRDGFIRLVDIKTGFVLQQYERGGLSEKTNIRCATTSCDTYLLSGSENGDVYIWNIDNGKIELVYSPYQVRIPINCIQVNARNNFYSISHFGSNLPLIVYGEQSISPEENDNSKTSLIQTKLSLKKDMNESKLREQGTNFRMILEKFDNIIK